MERYKYRNLPCSIAPDEKLWEVCGQDTDKNTGGSGVLEWCYDRLDALYMLNKMCKYDQFRNLEARKSF